ncbi:MAG TPA: hypothetical protein VLH15_08800 [Dehalococcoidales bacterium]|nr:hypothetical protein [Dehalococcoidales bacterium]
MKVLLGFLIGIGVVVLIAVLALGYLGFMPGVSNLFGSNTPRDLGVRFTAADFQSARAKTGTVHTDLPSDARPEDSLRFSGQRAVNTTFTESEFNSLIVNRPWKYYPLDQPQLKINPDGSVEFTARIVKSRIEPFALSLGFTQEDIGMITNYSRFLPGDPVVDIKGTCSVVNGRISQSITQAKIGRLDFTKQIQDNSGSIVNWIEDELLTMPGLSVKNFQFVNGKVHFEGTLPDTARSK